MLEVEAVVAISSEHPIRSLKPELGIGTRRVVWAHCTAAHADAPPVQYLGIVGTSHRGALTRGRVRANTENTRAGSLRPASCVSA